jgi:hypothetical protein
LLTFQRHGQKVKQGVTHQKQSILVDFKGTGEGFSASRPAIIEGEVNATGSGQMPINR